ncbi:MAG: tRNA-2-methylthio-N(6)-dimethylallyladenosine synthase [Stenotrophomonas maltophilia]|nr:MAG: tRNA-2-methylthio-N(6)-dimethylallyladenosine synthase [Stenotrophomonas maltophilia]
MAKKLFIQPHGWQMNEYGSSRMADLVGNHQALELTDKAEAADVILLDPREGPGEGVFRTGHLAHPQAAEPAAADR